MPNQGVQCSTEAQVATGQLARSGAWVWGLNWNLSDPLSYHTLLPPLCPFTKSQAPTMCQAQGLLLQVPGHRIRGRTPKAHGAGPGQSWEAGTGPCQKPILVPGHLRRPWPLAGPGKKGPESQQPGAGQPTCT